MIDAKLLEDLKKAGFPIGGIQSDGTPTFERKLTKQERKKRNQILRKHGVLLAKAVRRDAEYDLKDFAGQDINEMSAKQLRSYIALLSDYLELSIEGVIK